MHRLPDLELVVAHIVTRGFSPGTVSRICPLARPTYLRTASGSFAILAAIRRASSLVSRLASPSAVVGGKYVGGWYSFGEYDIVLIADVPNNESMTAIALAVAAGGAIRASKTTPLMTGAQAVEGMKKAADVAKVYR